MEIRIGGVELTKPDTTQKRISLLIWGTAGCGKTTLASTAPGKKCWLLFDPNGADSLENVPEKDNISVVDLSKSNYQIVMQGCTDNPFGLEQYLKDNTFDTVVLDSVTTYLDLCLKLAVATTKNASVEVPTMAGYSRRNSYMKQTLNNLIKLTNKYNKNIVLIGHEDNGQMDELGNIIKQTVMIGGSSNTAVCIMLSEIWYMYNQAGKHKIAFEPFGVKSPMKSRMFDTAKCRNIEWNFTPDKGGDGIKEWFNKWIETNSKITL